MIHRPPETQDPTDSTTNSKPMEDAEATKRKGYLKRMRWLLCVLLVVGSAVYAFNTAYIPSASMEPALRPGDRILTMRAWLAYPMQRTRSRGDIILFTAPPRSGQAGEKVR